MNKDVPLRKQALIQMTAGATAGLMETISMHPLDVIKTRLQLQKKAIVETKHPRYYHGITDCIWKIYKQEGLLAFSNGITPPLLIETPRRAVKFFMVEQYLKLFSRNGENSVWSYYLAGMAAGMSEAPFVTPFEVIKVNMQAQSTLDCTPSAWEVAKQIVKTYGIGLSGLLRGLSATVLRGGTYSAVYYGFYFSSREMKKARDDPLLNFLRDLGIGFFGGIMGSIVNTPFDVVKSRIQGPQCGKTENVSTLPTMKRIYKREGFQALYSGLISKMLRLSFGGAIMFVAYDRINQQLTILLT